MTVSRIGAFRDTPELRSLVARLRKPLAAEDIAIRTQKRRDGTRYITLEVFGWQKCASKLTQEVKRLSVPFSQAFARGQDDGQRRAQSFKDRYDRLYAQQQDSHNQILTLKEQYGVLARRHGELEQQLAEKSRLIAKIAAEAREKQKPKTFRAYVAKLLGIGS